MARQTYEFIPSDKNREGFTVTFEDDFPVSMEGGGDLKGALDNPSFHPLSWWEIGFGKTYEMKQLGGDEAVLIDELERPYAERDETRQVLRDLGQAWTRLASILG